MALKDEKERKAYQAAYSREYYQRNREKLVAAQPAKSKRADRNKRDWLWAIKSAAGCSRCEEKHPACLQFHHIDKSTKEFNISQRIRWSRERLLKEIEKCIVLCGNCHAKEHWPFNQVSLE